MIQTRTQTHAGIATDPPGELATRERELVATDYQVLAPSPGHLPAPPRHDRSAIAALALVSTMVIGVVGSLAIQIRSMPAPAPRPVPPPVPVQPQPVEEEGGLPLWVFGLGVFGLLCLARGASRPVASESVECGCPEVRVRVDVEVK